MPIRQPRILYVEDHRDSRQIMQFLLTKIMNFASPALLESTDNLVENIEAIGHDFDIIFLDLNIHPINGYDACALLSKHPRYKNAKIIALTASVSPHEIDRLRTSGFQGVVGKPINHATFPGIIRDIMEGKEVWEFN